RRRAPRTCAGIRSAFVRIVGLRHPRRCGAALVRQRRRGEASFVKRRAALAAAAGVVASALVGCTRTTRDGSGRVRLRLWYSLGGRNREVLLEIVRRFHAAQDDVRVEAVHQGEYFESLAKLRTAIAAKSAPGLSHVVAEVVPYLARANVLAKLDD